MAYRPPGWLIRAAILAMAANALMQGLRPMFTYRALEFGANASQIGFVAAAYATLPLVFSLAVGRWADRLGPRLFVLCGALLSLATVLGTGIVGSLLGLASMHAMLGLGHVSLLIGLQTLIANAGPQEDRDRRISVLTVAVAIGQMAGPIASTSIYGGSAGGFGMVIFAGTMLGVLPVFMAASMYVLSPPSGRLKNADDVGPSTFRSDVWSILRTRSVPQAIMASLLALATTDLIIVYLPAYGEINGIPAETVGQLLAVVAGGSLVGRSMLSPLISWFGRRGSLVICLSLPAMALTLFVLTDSITVTFITLAIAGFGLGLGPPMSLAALVAQVRDGLRGTAIGTRLTANRVGQLLMPAGVGIVAEMSGLGTAFLAVGGVLIMGAGLLVSDIRRPIQREVGL